MDCYLSVTINCHGQTLHSVDSEQFRYKTFYLLRGARLHNYYSNLLLHLNRQRQ